MTPNEALTDPSLEQQARMLGQELRCLSCQNETVDSSESIFAKDIRRVIRERLQAGDTPEDVRQYLVERYGDHILFRTPMTFSTSLLWVAPLVFLVGGLIGLITWFRRGPA